MGTMINGSVYNYGINAGSQAGNAVSGGLFVQGHFATAPLLNGTVVNGFTGINLAGAAQVGNAITGGSFYHW